MLMLAGGLVLLIELSILLALNLAPGLLGWHIFQKRGEKVGLSCQQSYHLGADAMVLRE